MKEKKNAPDLEAPTAKENIKNTTKTTGTTNLIKTIIATEGTPGSLGSCEILISIRERPPGTDRIKKRTGGAETGRKEKRRTGRPKKKVIGTKIKGKEQKKTGTIEKGLLKGEYLMKRTLTSSKGDK